MHRWLAAMLPVLLLASTCTAQPVSLSRLQAGPGPRYVPVTDAFGIQRYAFLDTLLGIPPWIVTDSVIAGPTAGNPQLRRLGSAGYLEYSFVGDLNTGMRRPTTGQLSLHAGSATPRMTFNSSVNAILLDPNADGLYNWTITFGSISSSTTGGPIMTNLLGFTFTGDLNTRFTRISAGVAGIYANNANPRIRINNPANAIVFDPDANGTFDVTMEAAGTALSGTLKIGTFVTATPSTTLAGLSSGGVNSVKIGTGLSLANDTLSAGAADVPFLHGYLGDGGIATLDSIVGSSSYDTLNVNYTVGANLSVTYANPPGSSYRAIRINKTGAYRITYHWTAKPDLAANNLRFRLRLILNSTTLINSGRIHYTETDDFVDWSADHIAVLQAGDFIHFIGQNSSANKRVLSIHTASMTVQYIGPGPS